MAKETSRKYCTARKLVVVTLEDSDGQPSTLHIAVDRPVDVETVIQMHIQEMASLEQVRARNLARCKLGAK